MQLKLGNIILILSVSLLVAVLLSLSLGSVWIPIKDLGRILVGQEVDQPIWSKIIWQLRLPRTLMALLAGAALAISGLLMQSFFRNPIAGPFVLGISSGAGLGAAVWIMGGIWLVEMGLITTASLFNTWALVIAACFGAGLVLLLILLLAWRTADINILLILGLMLGSAVSALVMLLQFFSGREELQRFVLWGMGDLSSVGWTELAILVPLILLTIGAAFLLMQPLNVLLLGEDYAKSMGVSVKTLRWKLILITAILAGSVTAFCGPIAFVGIAVPHLARSILRTQRQQLLMPVTLLLGMLLLLICQIIAQLPMQDRILPINAITSLLGAPVVVWIVWRIRA
jgi:iron complex transport system permease protein